MDQLIKERSNHIYMDREIDKAFVRAVDAAIDTDKIIKELNTGFKSMHMFMLLNDFGNYLALNFRL